MMLKSRLLHYTFLIGLAAIEAWSFNNQVDDGTRGAQSQELQADGGAIWKQVIEHVVVVDRDHDPKRVVLERIPDATSEPAKGGLNGVAAPKPTEPPLFIRQNDGQIQALSGRIQELSGTIAVLSLTLSAVSSASQSQKQSADQAIRSAQQSADQANQALTRAQTSAASALAQATQSANDQLAQATTSFNSLLSANMAMMQASASTAIAQAQAVAASQIGEARADATAVRGDANNLVAQVKGNSISVQNLAIIIVVSVVGSIIVTALVSWLLVRYRRKRRRDREVVEITDEKPLAMRGVSPSRYTPTPPSSQRYDIPFDNRFDPYGGGTGYPMDKLYSNSMGLSASRPAERPPEPLNFGIAVSDFTPEVIQTASSTAIVNGYYPPGRSSPDNVRLARPPSTKIAETVRLIRVGSGKSNGGKKDDGNKKAPSPLPAQPATDSPKQSEPPAPIEVVIRESVRHTMLAEAGQSPLTKLPSGTDRDEAVSETQPARPNTNSAGERTFSAPEPAKWPPKPKTSASFTTFPTVRTGPSSIVNRPRPATGLSGVAAKLREDAERRKKEAEQQMREKNSNRTSAEILGGGK